MRRFDFEVIKNVPYSAIVFVPPDDFHQCTFYKISYIECGSVEIEFLSRTTNEPTVRQCSIGDAFIVSPRDVHRYKVNEKGAVYRHRDIYVSVEDMASCCDIISPTLFHELTSGDGLCFFKVSSNEILALGERLSVFINRKANAELSAIHKSVVISLLGEYCLYKVEKHLYPAWIQDLLRNLEKEEYLKLSIEDIVLRTGYSYSYIARIFKKHLNISLKQYVNDKRLALAAVILVNSDILVGDIALSLRFDYANSFIKAFKKKYGVSPGKYRNEAKKKQTSIPFVDWGRGTVIDKKIED